MTPREQKLLFVLAAVAGVGAWVYFSKTGRGLVKSAGEQIQTGVQKLADLSDSSLNLIKKFESFSPVPYRDARGWSIGYGHFMGTEPTMQRISEPDAYSLLRSDAETASDAVKASVTADLNQNQFDALTSLAYNIGASAFANSTLVRLLNDGDYQGAADQFTVWRMSMGKVNNALVVRRAQERSIFLA